MRDVVRCHMRHAYMRHDWHQDMTIHTTCHTSIPHTSIPHTSIKQACPKEKEERHRPACNERRVFETSSFQIPESRASHALSPLSLCCVRRSKSRSCLCSTLACVARVLVEAPVLSLPCSRLPDWWALECSRLCS